jgi:hypothetical protein
MLVANGKINNSKKSILRRLFQVIIVAMILVSMLSACTPQTIVETVTNITIGTIIQTEQIQTTTATEIPITSTNTITTVTSSALTTTTKSTVITTLPLDSLDYPEVSRITAEELKILIDENYPLVIVDSRDSVSFSNSHIPEALSIPYDTLINPLAMDLKLMSLPKDRLIVFYCD